MGTSTRLPGPEGSVWKGPRRSLTNSVRALERTARDAADAHGDAGDGALPGASTPLAVRQAPTDERVRDLASRFYRQLIEELRTDPGRYQLIDAGNRAVGNLVEILSTLRRHGADGLHVQSAGSPKGREDAFIAAFIEVASRDAASPGTLTNAFVRRAAAQAATRLLRLSPTLAHDLRESRHIAAEIDDRLYCLIYQMFVADIVTAALTTFISAHLMVTLPFVPEADLTTAIAEALAEQVSETVISPCSKQSERHGVGSQLEEIAMDLAKSALERALGLEDPER